jgi:hypothetical protein
VIAATAQWLTRAYPAPGGTFSAILAERQARQAVTVAAWLRYPTGVDPDPDGAPARSEGVDEVLASWAACLLGDDQLALAAVAAVAAGAPAAGLPGDFRRLTAPDGCDRHAAALLRHPDLLAPVADLHRDQLLARLAASRVDAT